MELDAEVQLDEAVVAHFPILGIRGIMISHESSTSEIPRANYTEMAAFGMMPSGGLQLFQYQPTLFLECVRDIGLEYDCLKIAHPVAEYSTYHRA